MQSRSQSRFWFLNGLMLWGAVLGWFIGASVTRLQETARHKGPGVVHYGDGERSPEWAQKEPESQYKRHNYTMGGSMLLLGLGFWVMAAKIARDERAKSEAKEEYLKAQLRRAVAFQNAFASAIDAVSRERATGEALSSKEVEDAQENLDLAACIYFGFSAL